MTARKAAIVLKRMPKKDERMPAQARVLLTVLNAKGGTLMLSELCEAAKGKIKTVQPIEAIWNHYKRQLAKRGFVKLTVTKEGAK